MSSPKKKTTKKKTTTAKKKTTTTKKKKTTVKKTSKPKVVKEEVKEEVKTDEKTEDQNKAQEIWGNVKHTVADSVAKIPHGIEEQENKLKLTTSKLFALTGSLIAFFEGRVLFLSYDILGKRAYPPIVGAIGMLIGLFLFVTIMSDLILAAKAIKGKIPYEWYILLFSGMLLFFLNIFAASGGYDWIKGGVILMIGGVILLLEGLNLEKAPKPKVLVSLIGIVFGIYESIKVITDAPGNLWAIITAIIMLLILVLLFFATELVKIPEKFRPPLSWWFVLCVSVAMYYFGYTLSGAILIHVFLLELIDL